MNVKKNNLKMLSAMFSEPKYTYHLTWLSLILWYHLADSCLYALAFWYWYCSPRVDSTATVKVSTFNDFSHERNVFSVLSYHIGVALYAIIAFSFLLLEALELTLKLLKGIPISLQTLIIISISNHAFNFNLIFLAQIFA